MTVWDKIFETSGRVFKEPHPKMNELVDLFRKRSWKKILDLGCGTGRHLVFLAQNGFEVYGFDSSPNALKLSNKWLNNLNLIAETSLQKMEEDFPFENNFFDAVISIQVIHHNKAELVKKTVKEIERVMKKGGILFITIPDFHNYSRKHKWKLKEIENRTYIPLDGPEKGLIHHFFTKEEIHETFCNFKILEIGLDPTNHRYILAEKK